MKIDPRAPIVPAVGAAGIAIGTPVREVLASNPELTLPKLVISAAWSEDEILLLASNGMICRRIPRDAIMGESRGLKISLYESIDAVKARYPSKFRAPEPLTNYYDSKMVGIWVDMADVTVGKVLVKGGYEGKLRNQIGLGSTLAEFSRECGNWEYDHELEDFIVPGMPGIGFTVEPAEPYENSSISMMWVFQRDVGYLSDDDMRRWLQCKI